MLSQRNIVNRKALGRAYRPSTTAGEYVDGVGKEAVKGGLICRPWNGVRAFVPASQLLQPLR